jgi:hypothetical protein
VGARFTGYRLALIPGATWPTSGGDVLSITIERSTDGGATWQPDIACTFAPGPWLDKLGVAVTTANLDIAVGTVAAVVQQTGTGDKYRITIQVSQACRPGFQLWGLP